MRRANSSRYLSRRSPMFHRMRSRLEGSRPRQVLLSKEARARPTARSTSAASKSGTLPRSSPVAGLQISMQIADIVPILVHAADRDSDESEGEADHDDDG